MSTTDEYILGLDIGTNSVGWAVVSNSKNPVVIDLNSYIFKAGVAKGKGKEEESTNVSRRTNRLTRRQIARRVKRRRRLTTLLKKNKLLPDEWPTNSSESAAVANQIDASFAERAAPSVSEQYLWKNPFAMRSA